jgi:hypothetical protein
MKKSVYVLAILLVGLAPSSLPARTITLTTSDCDEMAVLFALAPRMSWGMKQLGSGIFNTQPTLDWSGKVTLLMRFPVDELIPPGQRITKAQFTIVAGYVYSLPVIQIRRVLAEWGPGVCYQYRMTYPKKLEWAQPGARGAAVDRTARDSAVIRVPKVGEYSVDVTEDIELWYTGAVPNRGWMMAFETDGPHIYIPSPYVPRGGARKEWKLQITFEPK